MARGSFELYTSIYIANPGRLVWTRSKLGARKEEEGGSDFKPMKRRISGMLEAYYSNFNDMSPNTGCRLPRFLLHHTYKGVSRVVCEVPALIMAHSSITFCRIPGMHRSTTGHCC